MILKIPIKLPSLANMSGFWTKKYKCKDNQHVILYYHLLGKEPPKLPCIIKLTRMAPRKLDDDNLQMSLKYIRDYLARWLLGGKLGQKDSDARIKWEYSQSKGSPNLIIEFIEI